MYGHGKQTALSVRLALWAVLGLVAPVHAAQAVEDRIFADGFEPCCRIGGTVSGLAGSGLLLHLQAGAISENHTVAGNGLYAFAASVAPGTAFTLNVDTQPLGQTCVLTLTVGTMGSSHIDNANVVCGGNLLLWDQGQWGESWQ